VHDIIATFAQNSLLIVFLSVLLSEAGVPVPAFPAVMTMAALAPQDGYALLAIVLAGLAGCLIADLAWYGCGRRYGQRILGWLCRISLTPDFCVRRTETVFAKAGPWSLLFAKYLPGVATLSVAMAGIIKTPLPVFLALDGIGALLLVGLPVALGHMFYGAIDAVVSELAKFGRLGALTLIGLVGIYLAAKWWRREAFIRQLRMDRITVGELCRLIDEGRNPLILDVRPKEVRARTGIVPGAVPASRTDIDAVVTARAHQSEIVVYCSCPNETSAAVAAKHLKQAGFKKIRPLLGGFDAWVAAGRAVERGAPFG
jgi:membrane protein DedA with SNARE-associated domain/rhodanese-related sulfurtransferase